MQDSGTEVKPDNFKTVGTGGSSKVEGRKENQAKVAKEGYKKSVEKIFENSAEDSECEEGHLQPKEFKLFIGGLTGDTTSAELSTYFSQIAQVKDAFVVVDSITKKPNGFGFVTLESQQDVDKVLANKHTIKGSCVDCKEALSKNEAKQKELDERQRKLFVGGLPKNLKDEVLRDHFSKFGNVQKAYVVKDYKSGNTRGFGFVIFADSESYNKALYSPELHIIQDKEIHVRETHSRKEEKEKGRTDKVPKTHIGDRIEHAYPPHYVYEQNKPVYMNYSPYPVPSTSSYRPGYVSYGPPPQPIYYVPEGYLPVQPSSGHHPPTYLPARHVPVPIAHAPPYPYPHGEEVYYIPAHAAPPTNMHFSYQPVYRMDGNQAFYQAVSTPQINTRYYNSRGNPQKEEVPAKSYGYPSRPGSQLQIKKQNSKNSNHSIAYSDKVISRSPKMHNIGGTHATQQKSGFSKKLKSQVVNPMAVGSNKKVNQPQTGKVTMPANLDNLEEESEEEDNIERVEEI